MASTKRRPWSGTNSGGKQQRLPPPLRSADFSEGKRDVAVLAVPRVGSGGGGGVGVRVAENNALSSRTTQSRIGRGNAVIIGSGSSGSGRGEGGVGGGVGGDGGRRGGGGGSGGGVGGGDGGGHGGGGGGGGGGGIDGGGGCGGGGGGGGVVADTGGGGGGGGSGDGKPGVNTDATSRGHQSSDFGAQPTAPEIAAVEELAIATSETPPAGNTTGVTGDSGKRAASHRSSMQGVDIVDDSRREGTYRSDDHAAAAFTREAAGGYGDGDQLDIDSSRQVDSVVATLPSDVDEALPLEQWSAQFRDKRLGEHDSRRAALLRELLPPPNKGGLPVTAAAEAETRGMMTATPERRCHSATAGAARTKRGISTGCSRYGNGRGEESGVGATLVQFKASVGLSAKGELFEDLFCRPSKLDEALTTEPGRRTPQQASCKSERKQASTHARTHARLNFWKAV